MNTSISRPQTSPSGLANNSVISGNKSTNVRYLQAGPLPNTQQRSPASNVRNPLITLNGSPMNTTSPQSNFRSSGRPSRTQNIPNDTKHITINVSQGANSNTTVNVPPSGRVMKATVSYPQRPQTFNSPGTGQRVPNAAMNLPPTRRRMNATYPPRGMNTSGIMSGPPNATINIPYTTPGMNATGLNFQTLQRLNSTSVVGSPQRLNATDAVIIQQGLNMTGQVQGLNATGAVPSPQRLNSTGAVASPQRLNTTGAVPSPQRLNTTGAVASPQRLNTTGAVRSPQNANTIQTSMLNRPPASATNIAANKFRFIQKANFVIGKFFARNLIIYHALFYKQKLFIQKKREEDYSLTTDFYDRVKFYKDRSKEELLKIFEDFKQEYEQTFTNIPLASKPNVKVQERLTKSMGNAVVKEKVVIEDHSASLGEERRDKTIGGQLEELFRSHVTLMQYARAQVNENSIHEAQEDFRKNFKYFHDKIFTAHISSCQKPRKPETEVVEETIRDNQGNVISVTRTNDQSNQEKLLLEVGNQVDNLLKVQVKRYFELQILQGNEVRQLKNTERLRTKHAQELANNKKQNFDEMQQLLANMQNLISQISVKKLPDVSIDLNVTPPALPERENVIPNQGGVNPFEVLFGGQPSAANNNEEDGDDDEEEDESSSASSSSEESAASNEVSEEYSGGNYDDEPSASPLVDDTYNFPAEFAHVLNRTNRATTGNVSHRSNNSNQGVSFENRVPLSNSTPKDRNNNQIPSVNELENIERNEQEVLNRCLQQWQAARREVVLSIKRSVENLQ